MCVEVGDKKQRKQLGAALREMAKAVTAVRTIRPKSRVFSWGRDKTVEPQKIGKPLAEKQIKMSDKNCKVFRDN